MHHVHDTLKLNKVNVDFFFTHKNIKKKELRILGIGKIYSMSPYDTAH